VTELPRGTDGAEGDEEEQEVAALGGIPLTAMTTDSADLEALFFELTAPTTETEMAA